jgi:hypothetical protein
MGQTCAAGFYPAFSKNMEAIGLYAPNTLFASQEKTLGTISQLAGLIKTFGMKVTIRELVVAGTATERLAAASAYYAAYYLGGAIGSLIVAADRYYACRAGATASEQLHRFMAVSGLALLAPMAPFLVQHPEVIDSSSPLRRLYALRARAPGAK